MKMKRLIAFFATISISVLTIPINSYAQYSQYLAPFYNYQPYSYSWNQPYNYGWNWNQPFSYGWNQYPYNYGWNQPYNYDEDENPYVVSYVVYHYKPYLDPHDSYAYDWSNPRPRLTFSGEEFYPTALPWLPPPFRGYVSRTMYIN